MSVPLNAPSKPKKLPVSAWLPGFLKSCQRLASTKPYMKNSTTSRAAVVVVVVAAATEAQEDETE